jgi:asparagine synthase (glutamine-hydrolysing)
MLAQLHHRGPDDHGIYLGNDIGLGHTRLSILDLAGGRQPMTNEDGTLWVTFNGEIFNYIELRQRLVQKGHRFATQSDTEVILHLYEEYGEECVQYFNGQWALAVWDTSRRRLFLSRDRLGIRPLFYTVAGDKLVFASEVKALFVHPDVRRAFDLCGLNQLFTFWTTLAPRTVFEGVRELPPGHNLVVDQRGGEVRLRRYWQLDYGSPSESMSKQDCADRLLELLTDATRLRLRADVPVGAYLSGGLDSSVTTALVKRCSSVPLRTFSIAFDDAEFDESRYQQEVVRALDTDHQTVRCTCDDIGRVFPEMIWHTERPVLRTAPAPLYLLSKLVRQQGYKVVVTGEGADEILGGYDVFKEAKVRRFWGARPESITRAALLDRLYPYLPGMRAQSLAYRKAFFHLRPDDLASPFFSHLPRWELTSRLKAFFSPEVHAATAEHDVYDDGLAMLPDAYYDWAPFCQAQYLETAILLPGYILSSQGDRMAMAHSVEGRYPFLDYRLAEFAATLKPRWKMRGIEEKYLLKLAAGHLVPESVVHRSKQPYRAPEAKSFFGTAAQPSRHEYVEELLSTRRIRQTGVFQPEAVEHLVEKVRRGRSIGIKDNMALVGILSTQLVAEQFLERPFGQPAEAAACHSMEE